MVQHTKLSEAHLKPQEVVIGPLHYVQALYGPNDVSINRSLSKPADLLQHQSAKTGGFFQRSGFLLSPFKLCLCRCRATALIDDGPKHVKKLGLSRDIR